MRGNSLAFRMLASCALMQVAVLSAGTAKAQTAPRVFDIPAQPLSSALNVFGRQSNLQVTLAASTSRGVTSRAVSGTLSPEAALARLLHDSGIPFSISNSTAVIGRFEGDADQGLDDPGSLAPIILEARRFGQDDVSETVIDDQQLQRLAPASIADVFRQEPGIQVGSSLPMSQKVYVRGVEETNLAISLDGARQNNKVFHHNATTLIDPSILKAVVVDAGIAPADAGPAALAGAIDYETKDADELLEDGRSLGGFVTSTWNSNSDTAITGLSAYGRHEGLDFLGYLTFGKGGDFSNGAGERVDGTETNLLSGIGKIGYEFDSGDRIEISHDRLLDDAPRPFRANASIVIPPRPRPWEPLIRDYRMERQNTVFTYTDESPEGWWDPKIMLAYGATEVTVPVYLAPPEPPALPTGPSPYDAIGETSTFNGTVENRFSLDIGSIVAGMDFYSDKASLKDDYEPGAERARNLGLYAQARIEPWDRTRLSFGGRADRQWFTGVDGSDFTNTGISGNISGEYDLTDILTAKAGFSRVWAGVPLTENFIINPGWDYGPDGPDPVTARNYLIGLEAEHEGFTAEMSLFRTDIDDARVPVYGLAAGGALRSRELVSKGFEIGAGYEWSTGSVKVRYVHIDVDVDGVPANSDSGNYLASPVGDIISISAVHAFENWNLTIGGDIEIAPEYDHVVENEAGKRVPYAAYEVVNIFAEWKPEQLSHFTFRAEVKNLLNETYSDRATYGQEFGNVTPLYEAGRSFLITAKATF